MEYTSSKQAEKMVYVIHLHVSNANTTDFSSHKNGNLFFNNGLTIAIRDNLTISSIKLVIVKYVFLDLDKNGT
jgi:hypothetical protein